MSINIDHTKDSNLDDFAMAKLKNNYLLPYETPQNAYERVANAYSDNEEHAQRLYNYMSDQWFTPASPVLSNGGTSKGLPISCFLNEVEDSLHGIDSKWSENVWLASRGGGIGTYWGNVRSIGEPVSRVGTSSGIIPFLQVQDSITRAISQGSQRRGASAAYLPIDHPEIGEFIDIRKPSGGDPRRKVLDIHHGVCISDEFMDAVTVGTQWDLKSPLTGEVEATVSARDLWGKILETRIETGEPYILFTDNVNSRVPPHHKKLGLEVKTSNLCSEITLPTGVDHYGNERTAVCCLSSLNLAKYDEWKHDDQFIKDVVFFLDNVLQDFIDSAPSEMRAAKYSAMRERSIGLGALGFHSYLQSKSVPFESVMAKTLNKQIFSKINSEAKIASQERAHSHGACPDASDASMNFRFSNITAIAPNASTSILAGSVSPSIEPLAANSFVQDTDVGSFHVKNKQLEKLLEEYEMNTDQVWSSITTNEGSVQHLDFLSEHEKDVFKTAFEINQAWVVELACDRAPYICQAQSVNLFLPADIDKGSLHKIHKRAWEGGLKSLYYCRSKSMKRADVVTQYDIDCLSCEG